MKIRKLLTLANLVILSGLNAGFADGLTLDFSGPLDPKWNSDNQYSISQADGLLQVNTNKTVKWAGFTYSFGSSLDLSANPVVNLTMRSDPGMILTLYLADASGNINLEYPVYASESFHQYTFDFSGKTGIDLTQVTYMIFTFNGAAVSFSGSTWIDEMRLGDDAAKAANFSAIPDFATYRDGAGLEMRINRIENASGFELSGGDGLIRNVGFDPIASGVSFLRFDTVPGATGSTEVVLTATGSNGAAANSQAFTILVEDNLPPTITPSEPIIAVAGQPASFPLSGISDGNATATQPLSFEVTSDNPAITGSLSVDRDGDSPHAMLQFTPAGTGSTSITLTLSDNSGGNESTSLEVPVNVYASLNAAPRMTNPGRQVVVANKGEQTITLSGIGDGDDGSQTVSISAVSGDESLIENPIVVDYAGGDTATLILTPVAANTGTTSITVTLTDDGGNETNNGNRSSVFTIPVETVLEALTGYVVSEESMPFQGDPIEPGTWRIEGTDPETGAFKAILPSLVEKDGAPAFKFECINKSTYAGVWINLPDLDLTENPSISYEILVEVTTQSKIQTHVYFWDDNLEAGANGARNLAGANNARMDIFPGDWRQFAVNYNDVEDGLIDNNGEPINTARIQRILFNFHTIFEWPFTNETFTVYLRQIKLGDQADVSGATPDATIAPVADQLFAATGEPRTRTLQLRNITNGAGFPGSIQVSTTNAAVVQDLSVGPVSVDGAATLTFKTSAAGTATVDLQVTAGGSNPASDSFVVEVVEADAPSQMLTIDRSQTFQTIRGFGTFEPPAAYRDLYTSDLGASAMRIGMISNQVEPANDNNDPFVLNRDGLDYGVWDFDKLRRFKEGGVETFILTAWSPAAWLKENLSTNFQQAQAIAWENTRNRLDTYFFEEYAESLMAAILLLREEAGIEVTAVGPQNEPAFNEPYPSAVLSPQKFAELIAVIGPRFEAEGIGTMIMMPEQVFSQGFYSMDAYMDAVQAHPVANQYTRVIATHGYANDGVGEGQPDFSAWTTMLNNATEGDYPKELWMSETFPEDSGFDSAMNYALFLYGALRYGNINLWTSWQIESQLIRLGQPLDQFHTFRNYSKYVRPGAVRIDISDGGNLYATAYEHAVDGTLTLVLVNAGETPVVAALAAAGGTEIPGVFTRHLTQEHRGFENMGSVGSTVLLPARSVTTLVGIIGTATEPPVITSALTANATELQSFSYTITATNNPTAFSASGLPGGLVLNESTGVISGTPDDGTAGVFNISLTATNTAGSDTETLVLTITERVNIPPVAAFSASPESGIEPLQVQFDATASADADGTITTYAWDFGDGGLESGQSVAHTFVEDGEYTVTLTVTDSDGAMDTAEKTIFVTMRPVVEFEQSVLEYPVTGSGGLVQHPFSITPSDADWTASEDTAWIILLSTSGNGPGTLNFRVQPNAGTARSAEITIWDSVLTIRQAGVSPWAGFPETDGWRDTDIGWLRDETLPFIYHIEHGHCYYEAIPNSGNYYLYSHTGNLGWLYINPAAYPNLYSFEYDSWLHYLEGSSADGIRWFYHLGDPSHSDDGWFTFPE
ncbi:MAG: PKD domain-containing protein [Oceanipulchritudo sp.]